MCLVEMRERKDEEDVDRGKDKKLAQARSSQVHTVATNRAQCCWEEHANQQPLEATTDAAAAAAQAAAAAVVVIIIDVTQATEKWQIGAICRHFMEHVVQS